MAFSVKICVANALLSCQQEKMPKNIIKKLAITNNL